MELALDESVARYAVSKRNYRRKSVTTESAVICDVVCRLFARRVSG